MNPQGGDNTAFIDEVAIAPMADSISDGSFEVPALAAKTFQYAPNGSPWQFSGAGRGEQQRQRLHLRQSHCPRRHQVAFLQGTGSMSQSVYLDAGTYSLSFLAAQRAGSQTHYQELQVLVDGAQVGTVTPASTSYGSYQTPNFTVTAGTHTIEFVGLNPLGGDNTAFIDEVAITASEL